MKFEIIKEKVTYPNNGLNISGYLCTPIGEGPFPCIIVLQEIFGINIHIREVTEKIAQEGYIALAPALYQRQAPDFESGHSEEDIVLGRKYKEQTKANELLSDIAQAISFLKKKTQCLPLFGTIGFCFGGHVAYLAATIPEIKATVSFYGAGIPTMTPGGGAPTLSRTKEIQGAVQCFFGIEDKLIPKDHVDQIQAELKKNGVDFRVNLFPAGHGFFCNHRPDYDEESSQLAWEKVKSFYKDKLR
ncbi:MAG: dienelactone hydrolase family protein [Bdellovibrionota bacterium]|nr:dienelactone hydrolase family protein [Bdellovibrionota bacterium]